MQSDLTQIGGLWFPKDENHFTGYGEKVADYQRPQSDFAMLYVKDFRLALDIGGHVGIFSRRFAERFERVIGFEPMENLHECYRLNCPDNCEIIHAAVSDTMGECEMHVLSLKNTGCSYIADDPRIGALAPPVKAGTPRITVPMITLDSLNLEHVGLIKLDVQGAEPQVMAGGRETILRCRPVILIEEKPLGGPEGDVSHIALFAEILTDLGLTKRKRVGADAIWSFD